MRFARERRFLPVACAPLAVWKSALFKRFGIIALTLNVFVQIPNVVRADFSLLDVNEEGFVRPLRLRPSVRHSSLKGLLHVANLAGGQLVP